MSQKLLIYGASEFGKQLYQLTKLYPIDGFQFEGFIDDQQDVGSAVIDGQTVVGNNEQLKQRLGQENGVGVLMAIGYQHLSARFRLYQELKAMGASFPNFVHPKAHLEKDTQMGEGNVVLAGATTDIFCRVGNLNYLDVATTFTHNLHLGDNNYFSYQASTGGFAQIGNHNFFGAGVLITDGVQIGSGNFVNARALIPRSLGDGKKVIASFPHRIFDLGEL